MVLMRVSPAARRACPAGVRLVDRLPVHLLRGVVDLLPVHLQRGLVDHLPVHLLRGVVDLLPGWTLWNIMLVDDICIAGLGGIECWLLRQ